MPSADHYLRTAINDFVRDEHQNANITIQNEGGETEVYHCYSTESYNTSRSNPDFAIGFYEAVFNHSDLHSNFWIKPDFVAIKQNISSACETYNGVFVEHCGSWRNFYQKRFYYLSGGLALFKKDTSTGYWERKGIKVDRVLYLLEGDEKRQGRRISPREHSIRMIKSSLNIDFEWFSFSYEIFRKKDGWYSGFNPQWLFDGYRDGERQILPKPESRSTILSHTTV